MYTTLFLEKLQIILSFKYQFFFLTTYKEFLLTTGNIPFHPVDMARNSNETSVTSGTEPQSVRRILTLTGLLGDICLR